MTETDEMYARFLRSKRGTIAFPFLKMYAWFDTEGNRLTAWQSTQPPKPDQTGHGK